MGVLYIKKDRLLEWMRLTRKNFLWLAREYGNVSPSYISQIINNSTNISGNFVGFILHETKFSFDDLFFYDETVSSRNFYGKEVYFNGSMLKSDEYRKVVDKTISKELITISLDIHNKP